MTIVKIVSPDGWMGHPKGSVVNLSTGKAVELVSRKVAEKKKAPRRPAKSKMVRTSKNK